MATDTTTAAADAGLDPAEIARRVDNVFAEALYWFPVRHHSPRSSAVALITSPVPSYSSRCSKVANAMSPSRNVTRSLALGSRPGTFWTLEDSGAEPVLHAFDATCGACDALTEA